MNFSEFLGMGEAFIQSNPVGSIAAGIILLFILFKRPKYFFMLILLCVAAIGISMIFDKLAATGISDKDFRSLNELK